jgi:hypothetical protein
MSLKRYSALLAVCALFGVTPTLASADMYIHNPPGSGALITGFQSKGLTDLEIKTGRPNPGHHKWGPVTFVLHGGNQAIGTGSYNYVMTAFKSKKPTRLNFSSVQIGPNGGRKVLYRMRFVGAVIQSATESTVDGQPALQVSMTFRQVTWTDAKNVKTAQDDWEP